MSGNKGEDALSTVGTRIEEGCGGKLTANRTYTNHLATVTSLQGCQESQTFVSSLSISQQQKFWFNHHPSEQYPILMSDSHSVTIDINAAFRPMHIPRVSWVVFSSRRGQTRPIGHSPMRLTTNHVCPASTALRICAHSHWRVISPRGPLCDA